MVNVAAGADELEYVMAQLRGAPSLAAVFGVLTGSADEQFKQAQAVYRRLAQVIHPDRHKNDPRATEAFMLLSSLWTRQQAVIRGEPDPASIKVAPPVEVVIKTRTKEYILSTELAQGDLAVLYNCVIRERGNETAGVFKIARDPRDNDLLEREAATLANLAAPDPNDRSAKIPPYFPRISETFVHRDSSRISRRANVFPIVVTAEGPVPTAAWFTAEEVLTHYKGGVDAKQVAWMWRRILLTLAHAQERGVLHGAVLPPHILIQPESHGLMLVDWTASLQGEMVGRGAATSLSGRRGGYDDNGDDDGDDRWYGRKTRYSDLFGDPPSPLPRGTGTKAGGGVPLRRDVSFAGKHIPFASPLYKSWYPPEVLARKEPTIGLDLVMAARCMLYLLGGDPLTMTAPSSVPYQISDHFKMVILRSGDQVRAGEWYTDFEQTITALWGGRKFIPFTMPARA